MRKAWPTISKAQQKILQEVFKEMNAIRLDLSFGDEDIHVAGDQASVNSRQAFTYSVNGKKVPGPAEAVHIVLHKSSRAWSIAAVDDR